MERQPTRRRRRRRRTSAAGREAVAWLALLFGLVRRAARWTWLILIIALILLVGLGAPMMPVGRITEFWSPW